MKAEYRKDYRAIINYQSDKKDDRYNITIPNGTEVIAFCGSEDSLMWPGQKLFDVNISGYERKRETQCFPESDLILLEEVTHDDWTRYRFIK